MNTPMSDERDRRPWKCVLCADRFAGDQSDRGTHNTVWAPRDARRFEATA